MLLNSGACKPFQITTQIKMMTPNMSVICVWYAQTPSYLSCHREVQGTLQRPDVLRHKIKSLVQNHLWDFERSQEKPVAIVAVKWKKLWTSGTNTGAYSSGHFSDCPLVAQPKPERKPHIASVERPADGSSQALLIQCAKENRIKPNPGAQTDHSRVWIFL